MKILAVESHYKSFEGTDRISAVDWWRTISPLKKVANKTGWDIDFVKDVKDFSILKDYDLVWTSYFTNILGYKAIIDSGVPLVIDFDDDFYHLSHSNPVRREYSPDSQAFKTIDFMIRHTPNITVSTNHLSQVYGKVRGGAHEHYPLVLENRISSVYDPGEITNKDSEFITIGWMGGATHYTDIFHTPFWGALTYLHGRFPNLQFKVMGLYSDADYKDLPHFEHHDGSINHPEFVEMLKEWSKGIDIFVAPLEDSLFNSSKSNIKVQECGIQGKPVVASSVRPYQEFNAHSNGLIDVCDTHKEWVDALERLIVDKELRRTKGEQLREFILKDFTIKSVTQKYIDYINYIVNDTDYPQVEAIKPLKTGKLNILLAVRRFETMTGSELYYYELAREYLKVGHNVCVTAYEVGDPLSRKIINLGGEVLQMSQVDMFQPDLIIASHEPVDDLKDMFICPLIQVVHSENDYLWPIEYPRQGLHHYVAVRDEIKDRIIKEGMHPDKVSVIWNPIDLERFSSSKESDKTLLFVGPQDKLRKKVIKDICRVATKKGLTPLFLGQGQHLEPAWGVEKYVKKCEMTASIYMGRTTLEGWACGKAGIIYQVDGDGNIESKRIVSPQNKNLYDSSQVAKRILDLC